MLEIGSAVLTIIPSAKGLGTKLNAETGPEVTKAGQTAGKTFSRKFADAMGVSDFKRGLREGIQAGVREADAEATKGGTKSGNAFLDGLRGAIRKGASGIDREVEKATSNTKAAESGGKRIGASMGNALKIGLTGMVAGIGGDMVLGLIKDAEESAKVGKQTAAIIKATGGAAKLSADQVGELATALSNKTAMDDEMVQSGMNTLLTFKAVRNEVGKGNDVFTRASAAAADLSAAGFGDMRSASVMLGKALNDPIKGVSALGRAGVQFTQQQKDQIKAMAQSGDLLGAQKIILKEVEGQVGGTAAASATSSEKMVVAWGNFREAIGTKLLPIFEKVVNFATEVALPALSDFSDTIARLWKQYAEPALTALGNYFTNTLKPIIIDFVVNTALPMFRDFSEIVKQAWETVIRPALQGLWSFITNFLGPVLLWLWQTIVQPVFRAIWTIISWAVKSVILPVLGWLINAIKNVGGAFVKTKDWIVDAWQTIREKSSAAWTWINTKVLDPLKNGFNKLKGFFGTVVEGIAKTWSGITEAIQKPIKYVVNEIIRDKLAGAWNAVADKLHLPKWEFPGWADGGPVTATTAAMAAIRGMRFFSGFDRGGWTGPGATYSPAGIVHADEFVIKKQSQRAISRQFPGLLDYMNQYGSMPGYAGGGMVYPSLIAWIKKNLPGIGITSTYRPGAITASGNRSYHSMGMAVDMSPSMAAFNKILATFGPSIAELIYSPAGGRQIKNGRPYMYTGAVRNMHFNHVHWAMRQAVGSAAAAGDFGDMAAAGGFSISNPVAEGLKKLISPLFSGARGLIDRIGGLFGNFDPAKMATAFAKQPVDAVDKWLQDKINSVFPPLFGSNTGSPDSVGHLPAGAGVQRWAPLVTQALGMLGQPTSLVQTVLRRMQQESGGNPHAINNWDINARNGVPSKGLMQVIDPTFRANMMPGYGNIWDPLSNILASMRYAIRRYGSLSAAYNRRGGYALGGLAEPQLYDRGGLLAPGLTLVSNQTGKYETVRTAEQEQDLREKMAAKTGEQIIINGVKLDTIGEFSDALSFAITRQQNRRRFR